MVRAETEISADDMVAAIDENTKIPKCLQCSSAQDFADSHKLDFSVCGKEQ